MKIKAFAIPLISILLFLTTACSKELPLKISYDEPKLVLNCILIAGEPIIAYVSRTIAISSQDSMFINNAIVELWEGDSLLIVLANKGKGLYESDVYAISGRKYTLTATVKGYAKVEGSDSVPYRTEISKAESGWGAHPFLDGGDIRYYNDYFLQFADNTAQKNYYEILFANQQKYSDSTYLITYESVCRISDPIIADEGLNNYFPEAYVFTDLDNSGKEYSISMSFSANSNSLFPKPLVFGPDGYYTLLRTVSNEYYKFKKSWYVHRYNQQISTSFEEMIYEGLTGDPIPLYSNVRNGYGIVAAYAQTHLKTEYTDNTK